LENNNLSLVSVVIPCYNHEQFVRDSIQSVINQTYQNIELIIIDDGSKDNSVEVIQQMISICEQRFTRFEFRSRPNKGLSRTLNEALTWCQGEYYSAIASDDQIYENKISKQVALLEKYPNAAGVFGGVTTSAEIKQSKIISKHKVNTYAFRDVFLHNAYIVAPTQLLKLDIVREVGGFSPDLIIEDWYLWLEVTKNGYNLISTDEVFAIYRRHSDNMSSNYDKMMNGRIEVLELYKNESDYEKALACAFLVSANDWLKSDIKKSLSLFKIFLRKYYDSGLDMVFLKKLIIYTLKLIKVKL